MSQSNDDFQLIHQVQNGDLNAFGRLYGLHQDRVRGIVSRYVRDRDEADDLLQVVFLKVYQGLDRFRGEAAFTTWLTRIAMNVCTTHLRTLRAQKTLHATFEQQGRMPSPTPEDEWALKERRQMLTQHIQALPDSQRRALWMRYMEDLSYREIERRLHVPEGTVKIWLFRGRHRLRQALMQQQLLPM